MNPHFFDKYISLNFGKINYALHKEGHLLSLYIITVCRLLKRNSCRCQTHWRGNTRMVLRNPIRKWLDSRNPTPKGWREVSEVCPMKGTHTKDLKKASATTRMGCNVHVWKITMANSMNETAYLLPPLPPGFLWSIWWGNSKVFLNLSTRIERQGKVRWLMGVCLWK